MTHDDQIRRTEATEEQFEGRAEQTLGGVTGDREEQAAGLTDEVKGKLRDLKSRLRDAVDGHDSDPGPTGRH